MIQQPRVMFRLLAIASLFLLFVVSVAWGADIVVSTDGAGNYRSVQRAIDAASYGDVILVNPGLYEEILVLISGITIRGAGPSHTIIRSSYGYQPVVQGMSVGSVVLEGIAFERGSSILESTVVDLQSSQVTFRNCHITGGQAGGVQSSGVSTLLFEDCIIENNLGYGLQIVGLSDITINRGRIADNGSVGLYLRDATAAIEETVFQWNEWDGIVLEGASVMDGHAITLTDNGRWGLRVLDSSIATVTKSIFETQAFGNIRLDDHGWLALEACSLRGGITNSVEATGMSVLQITDTEITATTGNGIALEEGASLTLEQSIVAHCGDHGLSLLTDGDCLVLRATVAYNGGNGLEFQGDSLRATHSIFALNDGVGLSVSASGTDRAVELGYNNVWGNRAGDYLGVHRSSSDRSEAPEFVQTNVNDFALSLNSPCIGSGAFGAMVGAAANPLWTGLTQIHIRLARTESELGSLEAGIAWVPSPEFSIDGHLAWNYDWDMGRIQLGTSLAGLSHFRTQGSLILLTPDAVNFMKGLLSAEAGLRGVWDGKASRGEAWGNATLGSDFASMQLSAAYEFPTRIARQAITLESSGFSLSGRVTNMTVTHLTTGWNNDVTLAGLSSTLGVHVRLVPDLQFTWTSQWHLSDGTIWFDASAYPDQLDTATFSLGWRDAASAEAAVNIQLRSGQFEDGEIRVRIRLATMELGAALGANAVEGPRCTFDVTIDTDRWFLPRLNQSPIPAFTYAPLEPEAGELITFDASNSSDPDGSIDQIWWDFGDSESAIGPIVHHRFSEPGEHTITLTISDQDGAVTTLIESVVVAEAQTTPVAAFTWAPVTEGGTRLQRALRAGDFILLDAIDSQDPDGTVVEYAWDVQSDGIFDWISAESRLVIDPLSAGTWPVTLRIIDNDGHSDAIMRVLSIEELKPPIASFELSPSTPAVGDPIRFVDTSMASDGTLLSWEWDFGNGHTSREREPTVRYDAPGTYQIRLTVRDNEGLVATTMIPVSVQLNPELVPIQQTWALVIGISDYSEVEDLSYARRDAEAIATWLLNSNVPADHIRLLTDDVGMASDATPVDIEKRLATLVNVREGLGWLRQMANPEDLVLIHFSGHGYQGVDDNLDERDGVDEFFVLYDTRAAAKDDTALRDDEFGRFLDRIESQHVLVFFDSCYSGGLSRSLTPGSRATGDTADVFSDFKLEGRLILSASSENQDAFESPQLEHGVLTHFLLSGLDGAADLNADGRITIWELFEYVRAEVPPFVLQERGEQQLPQLIGEGESRVILTRSALAESPVISYCPAIPFAGAETWFRAEANTALNPASLVWDFGNGNTATGQAVAHRFSDPGDYLVRLSVLSETGESAQLVSQTVAVADWATILSTDDTLDQVVISVGRQHGVTIGDLFSLASSGSPDEPIENDPRAGLEVIELVDEDLAACQVLDPGASLPVGNLLIPENDSDEPPCWETP